MKQKVKFLFFCMIFVGGGVFGQNKLSIYTLIQKESTKPRPNAHLFHKAVLPNETIAYRNSCWGWDDGFTKIASVKTFSTTFYYNRDTKNFTFVKQDDYLRLVGFICKKELQLEKLTKIPFRFRLGSLQQCDYLEGKPNAGKGF